MAYSTTPTDHPTQEQQSNSANAPQQTLKSYITSDMVASTLFSIRIVSIVCSLIYFLSTLGLFSGGLAYRCYLNAFLTSFFTFSIRLYQRKKQQEIYVLSKEMYVLATTEDSGHYMIYTFFYYNQIPLSIYLIPPFLYAILFTVTYTNGLIPFLPRPIQQMLSRFNDSVAQKQQEIKRFIASTEIFIMFVVIWNALTGHMFILAPFLHYHFLKLRYQSIRNPSIRAVFSDLRVGMDYLSRHPKCPLIVSTLLSKVISIACSLAPIQHMRREA